MQRRNRQLNHFCGGNRSARMGLTRLTAAVAALSTVLMLATPAFALDLKGKLLHTHNEFCRNSEGVLLCPLPELEEHEHSECCFEAAAQGHVHEETCYTMERGALICTVTEAEGHIHTAACYKETAHEHQADCYTKQKGEQTCTIPEQKGHTHGSACYASGVLICEAEENEDHTHGNSCYEQVLKCETPEEAAHTHSDDCFAWTEVLLCSATEAAATEKVLICTETEAHVHGDSCYEWTKKLSCGMEEVTADGAEPERVLICTRMELKNHIHSGECYKTGRLGKGKLICKQYQLKEHQHTKECVDLTGAELICKENETAEHQHDHLCYRSWNFLCQIKEEPDDKHKSDPKADVETPEIWEKTFEDVKLTGAWSHDLLAIAQTQLGYEESERNFVIQAGIRRGYTRYGEWYGGVEYGDWCAMFIAFCMHYAGVEGVPFSCSCGRWIDFLEEAGMYVPADTYTPRPGDLVFFDSSRSLMTPETAPIEADHVAIVTEVIPATQDEPAAVVTLEGNYYNCVRYETRYLDDPRIIGYALLPDGPAANYSCGLKAHVHDDGCYDIENLVCRIQPHTHGDTCRIRKLQYEDASVKVDITLSDVMYLPADLSLRVAPVTEEKSAVYSAMTDAVNAAMSENAVTTENSLFCQLQLIAEGQPWELPAGVRADVQVAFKQPLSTAKATLEAAQRQMFLLMEGVPEESSTTISYRTVELTGDWCQIGDNGIVGVRFTSNRICAFSVVVGVPQHMTPKSHLKLDLIA